MWVYSKHLLTVPHTASVMSITYSLSCVAPARYVRILGNVVHAIQIKTKLCQLVEVMMERRDDLSFCQEMKFRWGEVHSHQLTN